MDRAADLKIRGKVISGLARSIQNGARDISSVVNSLKTILKEEWWKERIITTGEVVRFDRFIDFVTTPPLEGLGTDVKTIMNLCRDDLDIQRAIDRAVKRPVGPPMKDEALNSDIVTNNDRQGGNSRQAAYRRLEKEGRTDLLDRIDAGEISPHRAMIEAGFRKPPKTINLNTDPFTTAQKIVEMCGEEYLSAMFQAYMSMWQDKS